MSGPAVVGYSAVLMLLYSLMLIGIHSKIPHPSVTPKVMKLSFTSLALLTLAQACIVGTYFLPHISGLCICGGLWSAALVFYVFGLYTLKFVYIERISILNKHPMLASPKIKKWIKYITCSLIASCIISVTMMVVLTDGECAQDLTEYGCKPQFHPADVWLAIAMILFDACLFAGFCYKWWSLIKVFKLSSDSQVLVEMITSFSFQFLLTVCAMLSCVIDGIVNLWYPDYSSLIVFCVDCAVIASCDFAMIKESQAFMWKYLCWPCRIPAFIVRGTDAEEAPSRSSKTGNKPIEPSKTSNLSLPSNVSGKSETVCTNTGTLTTNTSEQGDIQMTVPQMTPQPPAGDLPEATPKLAEMVTTESQDGIEIITSDDVKPHNF